MVDCLAEQLEVFLDVQLVADLGFLTDVWMVVRMDCGQVEQMVALWDVSLVVLMVTGTVFHGISTNLYKVPVPSLATLATPPSADSI
jgi:hypothetical protein